MSEITYQQQALNYVTEAHVVSSQTLKKVSYFYLEPSMAVGLEQPSFYRLSSEQQPLD